MKISSGMVQWMRDLGFGQNAERPSLFEHETLPIKVGYSRTNYSQDYDLRNWYAYKIDNGLPVDLTNKFLKPRKFTTPAAAAEAALKAWS